MPQQAQSASRTLHPAVPVWLSARHRHALAGHLQALDADDRVRRFARPLADADILIAAASFDFSRDWFLGVVSPDGRIAGFAQARPHAASGKLLVEVALSVLPAARGRAFARGLLETLVDRVHTETASEALEIYTAPDTLEAGPEALRAAIYGAGAAEVCCGMLIEAPFAASLKRPRGAAAEHRAHAAHAPVPGRRHGDHPCTTQERVHDPDAMRRTLSRVGGR